MVWAALVSLQLSRVLLRVVCEHPEPHQGYILHLRWSAYFDRYAHLMLCRLIERIHGPVGPDPFLAAFLRDATDPNRHRFETRFLLARC